jgi:hypothetical protein
MVRRGGHITCIQNVSACYWREPGTFIDGWSYQTELCAEIARAPARRTGSVLTADDHNLVPAADRTSKLFLSLPLGLTCLALFDSRHLICPAQDYDNLLGNGRIRGFILDHQEPAAVCRDVIVG